MSIVSSAEHPMRSSSRERPSRRHVIRAFALGSAAVVAGCGGGPAPVTFDLTAPRVGLRRSGGRQIIIVSEPTAIFALDTERVVVRAMTGEITYLPRAQWSDRLPRLVQTRIVQTFENAGRVAVARPGDRLNGAFQLVLDLRAFEIREVSREAVVEIAAKLANASSGSIRTARLFTASAPVAAIDGPGGAAALDQALAKVLSDLSAWAAAVA
jgi:cholesterol transport system auxiliary component